MPFWAKLGKSITLFDTFMTCKHVTSKGKFYKTKWKKLVCQLLEFYVYHMFLFLFNLGLIICGRWNWGFIGYYLVQKHLYFHYFAHTILSHVFLFWTECPAKTYGFGCQQCPQSCRDSNCEKFSESVDCTAGCEPGYKGHNCSEGNLSWDKDLPKCLNFRDNYFLMKDSIFEIWFRLSLSKLKVSYNSKHILESVPKMKISHLPFSEYLLTFLVH